jgi:hypothetical protein
MSLLHQTSMSSLINLCTYQQGNSQSRNVELNHPVSVDPMNNGNYSLTSSESNSSSNCNNLDNSKLIVDSSDVNNSFNANQIPITDNNYIYNSINKLINTKVSIFNKLFNKIKDYINNKPYILQNIDLQSYILHILNIDSNCLLTHLKFIINNYSNIHKPKFKIVDIFILLLQLNLDSYFSALFQYYYHNNLLTIYDNNLLSIHICGLNKIELFNLYFKVHSFDKFNLNSNDIYLTYITQQIPFKYGMNANNNPKDLDNFNSYKFIDEILNYYPNFYNNYILFNIFKTKFFSVDSDIINKIFIIEKYYCNKNNKIIFQKSTNFELYIWFFVYRYLYNNSGNIILNQQMSFDLCKQFLNDILDLQNINYNDSLFNKIKYANVLYYIDADKVQFIQLFFSRINQLLHNGNNIHGNFLDHFDLKNYNNDNPFLYTYITKQLFNNDLNYINENLTDFIDTNFIDNFKDIYSLINLDSLEINTIKELLSKYDYIIYKDSEYFKIMYSYILKLINLRSFKLINFLNLNINKQTNFIILLLIIRFKNIDITPVHIKFITNYINYLHTLNHNINETNLSNDILNIISEYIY